MTSFKIEYVKYLSLKLFCVLLVFIRCEEAYCCSHSWTCTWRWLRAGSGICFLYIMILPKICEKFSCISSYYYIMQASHARIAVSRAQLGLPELSLGVIPGSGGKVSIYYL